MKYLGDVLNTCSLFPLFNKFIELEIGSWSVPLSSVKNVQLLIWLKWISSYFCHFTSRNEYPPLLLECQNKNLVDDLFIYLFLLHPLPLEYMGICHGLINPIKNEGKIHFIHFSKLQNRVHTNSQYQITLKLVYKMCEWVGSCKHLKTWFKNVLYMTLDKSPPSLFVRENYKMSCFLLAKVLFLDWYL